MKKNFVRLQELQSSNIPGQQMDLINNFFLSLLCKEMLQIIASHRSTNTELVPVLQSSNIPGQLVDLMDEERGRPVPLKHAKTSDNFNEPRSSR